MAGEVRLSTVNSIRGVDAERVILLDVAGLEKPPERVRRTLLNIALSRARGGTTVVQRSMDATEGSHRAFVESLVRTVSKLTGGDIECFADEWEWELDTRSNVCSNGAGAVVRQSCRSGCSARSALASTSHLSSEPEHDPRPFCCPPGAGVH